MSITSLPDPLSNEAARAFAGRAHQLLIGGDWVPAAGGETFETLDPATGHPITTVAQGGPEDIDRAVRAARTALTDGPWATMAAADRGLLLSRLADALEGASEEFAQLEALDNGKPAKMAQFVDVAGAVAHLRHFAGWPER